MSTFAPFDVQAQAFPHLDEQELDALEHVAKCQTYRDGEAAFKAGDADIDLFIVKQGRLDILNPSDSDRLIVSHMPGQFAGDIDILTRRPVIVTAVARGPETVLLRIPGKQIREVLNTIPRLSEKLMNAFTIRRKQLMHAGILGLKVVGPKCCKDTTIVREFLYKNFVP